MVSKEIAKSLLKGKTCLDCKHRAITSDWCNRTEGLIPKVNLCNLFEEDKRDKIYEDFLKDVEDEMVRLYDGKFR
jgi:hypothetical protein